MKHAFLFFTSMIVVPIGSVFGGCGSSSSTSPDGGGGGPGGSLTGGGGDGSGGGGSVACTAATPDDKVAIFVDKAAGFDTSCGSRAQPCETIAEGIAAANGTAGKTIVHVAGGTYTEAIDLDGKKLTNGTLQIDGGWRNDGGTFTRACADDPRRLVVVKPAAENVTVRARGLQGALTLKTMLLQAKDAAPGESLYGVFASGAAAVVQLDDVAIEVGAGGAGATPAQPAQPAQASVGCLSGSGLAGGAGGATTGTASAAAYTAAGYTPGAGAAGNAGLAGSHGIAGAVTTKTGFNCDLDTCQAVACTSTSTPGASGCGGAAGLAGAGGAGGGASIGIYAWDATVTVGSSSIKTAGGGVGGAGGPGGAGGAGGVGGAGVAGDLCGASCMGLPAPPDPNCKTVSPQAAQPKPGGTGGAGGNGSDGGPGPGGDSYCAYKGGAGKINVSHLDCALGGGGAGGTGAPAAPAGASAASN